jgi:hypothetical protein
VHVSDLEAARARELGQARAIKRLVSWGPTISCTLLQLAVHHQMAPTMHDAMQGVKKGYLPWPGWGGGKAKQTSNR